MGGRGRRCEGKELREHTRGVTDVAVGAANYDKYPLSYLQQHGQVVLSTFPRPIYCFEREYEGACSTFFLCLSIEDKNTNTETNN